MSGAKLVYLILLLVAIFALIYIISERIKLNRYREKEFWEYIFDFKLISGVIFAIIAIVMIVISLLR